jgi:hypothetical protein
MAAPTPIIIDLTTPEPAAGAGIAAQPLPVKRRPQRYRERFSKRVPKPVYTPPPRGGRVLLGVEYLTHIWMPVNPWQYGPVSPQDCTLHTQPRMFWFAVRKSLAIGAVLRYIAPQVGVSLGRLFLYYRGVRISPGSTVGEVSLLLFILLPCFPLFSRDPFLCSFKTILFHLFALLLLR